MTLELVDAGTRARVDVSVTMPAVHQCPFKGETDTGRATLVWRVTDGMTVELHSLRALLDSLDQWVVSHEAYTVALGQHLQDAGVAVVSVTTEWDTAGGQVSVSA